MKPPEAARRDIALQWLQKADGDFEVAEHLLADGGRFREAVAFHCQQAVEKYVKAILVKHGIEFAKTHDIRKLLELCAAVRPDLPADLNDADMLTPFGVEVRYPGDAPELLPGEELQAFEIATRAREAAAILRNPGSS